MTLQETSGIYQCNTFAQGLNNIAKLLSTMIQNCGDNECKIDISYCPTNQKRTFSNIFAIFHYYLFFKLFVQLNTFFKLLDYVDDR